MNLILFNGPPRSGKDSGAWAAYKFLASQDAVVIHEKFSRPNKEAFAGMMHTKVYPEFVVEPYESRKEADVLWLGVSYRQWQIDFSEKFMKPLYGNDIFGRLLLARLDKEVRPDYVVVSDCGFQIEVDTVTRSLDFKNILLITLSRPGCSFKGDSREYVSIPTYEYDPRWTHHAVENGFLVIDHYHKTIKDIVSEWKAKIEAKSPGSPL